MQRRFHAQGVRMLRDAAVPDPVDEMRRILRWGQREELGADRVEEAVLRRARREPLSHITGRRCFWTLEFEVSGSVLDPRPESESVVEAVLSAIPADETRQPMRILDLGVGSGCLLLSLLSELPSARGTGVDRSEAALQVARRNAARLELEGRCNWFAGEWAAAIGEPFDVVIANPPYVESDVIDHLEPEVRLGEPRLALDGGSDGLDAFREMVPQLRRCLARQGFACLEFGSGQEEAVQSILRDAGFSSVQLGQDLDGRPRCALARFATGTTRRSG